MWGSGAGAIVAAARTAKRLLDPELLRKSLKLVVAALITAAIAVHTERIAFVWYPLLAVVMVVDDNDEQTVKAARSRILGTVVGGLVTFLVHTLIGGWVGVLLSILLMVPVLRAMGWESGLSTGALVSVMFLMLPEHEQLNWFYVFNRAIDTVVGCVVALLVGLLFWPRSRLRDLRLAEQQLLTMLEQQLHRYHLWQNDGAPRPAPLNPASLSGNLMRMERWVDLERGGPNHNWLKRHRWRQRLVLWRNIHHHWIQWERLLPAEQPREALAASLRELDNALVQRTRPNIQGALAPWLNAAEHSSRPLPLLAVAQELDPLLRGLTSLGLVIRAERA